MTSATSAAIHWFEKLSLEDSSRFLAVLAHELTIGQRALCADGNIEGVRQLNEANHHIAGLLIDSCYGRHRSQPEFVLFTLTELHAQGAGGAAWKKAVSRFRSSGPGI